MTDITAKLPLVPRVEGARPHASLSVRADPPLASPSRLGSAIAAAIVSLIYFFPVFWIILTAFKTYEDAMAVPAKFFYPDARQFRACVQPRLFRRRAGAEHRLYALFLQFPVHLRRERVAGAGVGTLAAFGFSRYPLKGNDTYLFMILTTRMLPAIVVIIPIFIMFRVTGLAGTYVGIIALYTVFNLPFAIWMMKSFFDELSPDVEDAARIDGSSDVRVFFKICLPQVLAGLAATAVFGLILTWKISVRPSLVGRGDADRSGRHVADDRWRHRRPLGSPGRHRNAVPDPGDRRDLCAAKPAPARRHVRHHQEIAGCRRSSSGASPSISADLPPSRT